MVKIRFSLLWLLLILPAMVPLQAVDVRLERLGAWGNDGYSYIESGPNGPIGFSANSLDFFAFDAAGTPRVAASRFLLENRLRGLQQDGAFLWLSDGKSLHLVQLGDADATTLLRHTPQTNLYAWTGDRNRLVVQAFNKLLLYRVADGARVTLEREIAWTELITQVALLGDDLIVQGEQQVYALAFANGDYDSAVALGVAEGAAFAGGGLAVIDQTLFAVDQAHDTLATWVRDQNGWTPHAPVAIGDSYDPIVVRHLNADHILLGDNGYTAWLFEHGDANRPVLVKTLNDISHDDLLPLSSGEWLIGNQQGLQRATLTDDGFEIGARLEQGGAGGDLVVKGSVIFWVKGDALWLFDRRDPFNPTPIKTVQTGPVHQLRLEGNLLAVAGDALNLYDVSNPLEPKLLNSMPTLFDGIALQNRLLVGASFDADTDLGHLMFFNVSNAAQPQLLLDYSSRDSFKDVAIAGDQIFGLEYSHVLQYRWDAATARLEQVARLYTGTGHVEHENFTVRDGQVLTYWSNGNLLALDYDETTPLRATVNYQVPGGGSTNASRLSLRDGWLAAGGKDLVIIDANQPHQLTEIGRLPMAGVKDVAWQGNLLFVSGGGSGRLEVVRLKQVVPPVYLPWISNSSDFPSDLTVVNEGPLAQTLTMTAMLRNAEAQTITRTIPGDSAQVWSVESLFPGQTGYSLKLASETQTVQAFLHRRDRKSSVVQPAVREAQVGGDLFFPTFQGAAALRALVVTPLTTQSGPVAGRLQRLNPNGAVLGEQTILLEPAEPNVVILPEGDFAFRVAMERDVAVIGEQFRFENDGGHSSVLGWSSAADSAMRGPLTDLHQWVNPDAYPWRFMAARQDQVAVADSKRVLVLGSRLTGVYQQATIEGFDDIRDMSWGESYLVVADSKGVVAYEVDYFGAVTELARIEQADVIQVATSTFPNHRLMVGTEVGLSEARWQLYDWPSATQLKPIAEGRYVLPQRFSFVDGYLTFFPDASELEIQNLRNAPEVQTVQRMYHNLLRDNGNHQLFYHGGQVLWLYPPRGLFSLYRPWYPDYSQAANGFSAQFLAQSVAILEDAVLVADRDNGLKLVDISNPFDLKTVDHLLARKTNLVAAHADRMWAADRHNGDVRLLVRGTPQPQWHVPYLPTDQGALHLDYHRRLADFNYLHWTAGAQNGVLPIEQSIGSVAVDSLSRNQRPAAVSFTANLPTAAWLRGDRLRWVPTVRDHELGSVLMVPLFDEMTPQVTLNHDGVADEIVFTLYLADGVEVTERRFVTAALTTTFTLAELFDAEVLAQAKALSLEADADARFTAAVHVLQNGALTQLIPATRVR